MKLPEHIKIACRLLGVMAVAMALQACTSILVQTHPVPSDEVKIAAASFQSHTTTMAMATRGPISSNSRASSTPIRAMPISITAN